MSLPPARRKRLRCAMSSEFADPLRRVASVPGVVGVVLSDDVGYAIDYVHDPTALSDLDVQIVGAQLGQPLSRLLQTARSSAAMTNAVVLAEGHDRTVLCAAVAGDYVMAALLDNPANLALALQRFESTRTALAALLA